VLVLMKMSADGGPEYFPHIKIAVQALDFTS